jgi:hypothetical protein
MNIANLVGVMYANESGGQERRGIRVPTGRSSLRRKESTPHPALSSFEEEREAEL